jgi:hypothetical protein
VQQRVLLEVTASPSTVGKLLKADIRRELLKADIRRELLS